VAQLYLLCVLITVYEVAMRYVFNRPSIWAYEIIMVLCATAWILSVGYVTHRRSHIAITIVAQMLPARARRVLDFLCEIVATLIMATLAYASWGPAAKAIRVGELTASAFNSPEPMLMKSLLVGGAAMYAIQGFVNIVKRVRNWEGEGMAHGH
jgi:TRAP-type mannitol/chloroaromatic compound transport system permease small subunit